MKCRITVQGQEYFYEAGTTFGKVAEDFSDRYEDEIVLVFENGRLRELEKTVKTEAELSFVTVTDKIGFETYRRSCSMLFFAALQRIPELAGKTARLCFSAGAGFYYEIAGVTPNEELADRIDREMRLLTAAEIPFEKKSYSTAAARELFRSRGMHDKDKLFKTRIASRVNVYSLGEYVDYCYGFMLPNTRILKTYQVYAYENGFILQMPERKNPNVLPAFSPAAQLLRVQKASEDWASGMRIGTVGDLNECVVKQETRNTILLSEALQESRIAEIAKQITERPEVRFVMIAGPSSSGKTTFSQRLCTQLQAHGKKTHYLGVDNYFIDRDKVPLTAEGKKDFESLHSIDLEKFNRDMTDLMNHDIIRLPYYDFISGKSLLSDETLELKDDELLVIEGIHCLNDKLSYMLPRECKFKIYISALTQLNIDEHNRIPTTDGRLIRRIVRDYRTRGYAAADTLAMWDNVRKGEEENIFPYQESADAMFNSALPYELGVFRLYAAPLLYQVSEDDPEYPEAKRLLKFLDYFIPIPSDDVPTQSILREFIGGGCYHL